MVAIRSILAVLAALFLGAAMAPQAYTLDPANSDASAKVSFLGLGSKTAGFPKVSGSVRFNEARPEAVSLNMVIDATALTAGDSVTRNRLKSENSSG